MNVYCYRLKVAPASRFGTPMTADSLFGALCWEVVNRQGQPELLKMLERFRKGDPPFMLSNAFPGDLLPRPLVLAAKSTGAKSDGKSNWITHEEFMAVREGRGEVRAPEHPEPLREVRELHSLGGRVFETQDWTWSPEWAKDGPGYFSVYARVSPEWVEPLRKLLQSVGAYGFGKRRGTGRGQFTVDVAPEACPWLEPMPFESGFVSLSNFVPQETDPARGRWSVLVKYPKYSAGAHANGATKGNPLKGRLLQLEAGSCFQSPGRPRRWYGSMIPAKSGDTDGPLHYGLALAIGIKWPTEAV
jgi:CRISPR-associated protein Csm4